LRRPSLRLQVDNPTSGVLVDAEIYALSPYGGLIRYWNALIGALVASAVPVELQVPDGPLKAPLPIVPVLREPPSRWVFHPSYVGLPPRPVDAFVFTVHDTIYEDDAEAARELDPIGAALAAKRRCIEQADLLICPSETTKDGLARHYAGAQERAVVIPHVVDDVFSRPLSRDRLNSRPYLLHVGGREHYKNFPLLLRAFLASLWQDFDLVVVGSQPEALPHEARVLAGLDPQVTSSVRFVGRVSDRELASLYSGAAACVVPSLAEGFGLVAAEALAMGVPVAHSDIPVFRETLRGLGHPFDPESAASLVRAVRHAVHDGPRAPTAPAGNLARLHLDAYSQALGA
jgi:glycosyltransferase involved in cell wall biosynthesis